MAPMGPTEARSIQLLQCKKLQTHDANDTKVRACVCVLSSEWGLKIPFKSGNVVLSSTCGFCTSAPVSQAVGYRKQSRIYVCNFSVVGCTQL